MAAAPAPRLAETTPGDASLDAVLAAARARIGAAGDAVGLLAEGAEAFALRVASARAATRRLDLQYYAWHGDRTGTLLAREVLAAARRGVRVRLLLDDVFAHGRERMLTALDAHPRLEVRVFNASRWRGFGGLGFALEMLLGGWHLNRRMHNKLWIADGHLAIAGGRNLGDAYFDAAETFNFRDLDVVLSGPSVAAAGALFEAYWTSGLARAARAVSAARDARGGLATLSRRLVAAAEEPVARQLLADIPEGEALAARLARCLVPVGPEAGLRVVADPPAKARGPRFGKRRRAAARARDALAPVLAAAFAGARHEALLISPYFIPGEAGMATLLGMVRRGVRVSVVTNSLAATDVVAVHGGYAKYREALLAAGIALHELKRSGGERATLFGSRGASLHTKALLVDGALLGVGSFNLDPRSASLNTEMGVFVAQPQLAAALAAEHARLADPARSWRLEPGEGGSGLAWVDTDAAGRPRRQGGAEPGAGLARRLLATLMRWLPVEKQL